MLSQHGINRGGSHAYDARGARLRLWRTVSLTGCDDILGVRVFRAGAISTGGAPQVVLPA